MRRDMHGLRRAGYAEAFPDAAQMVFDRALGQAEQERDVRLAATGRHPPDDFLLAVGQSGDGTSRRGAGQMARRVIGGGCNRGEGEPDVDTLSIVVPPKLIAPRSPSWPKTGAWKPWIPDPRGRRTIR